MEKYAVPNHFAQLWKPPWFPVKADKDVLNKIGKGFADGYDVKSATYIFTPPDRVEVRGKYGIISGDIVYTNTTRHVSLGFIHTNADISKDLTKRQTVFVLGLLPQNYLDTIRVGELGQQTINGIPCDSYMRALYQRRPQRWPAMANLDLPRPALHGEKDQLGRQQYGARNRSVPLIPWKLIPGLWVPTQVQAFDSAGELGGIAEQRGIKAS